MSAWLQFIALQAQMQHICRKVFMQEQDCNAVLMKTAILMSKGRCFPLPQKNKQKLIQLQCHAQVGVLPVSNNAFGYSVWESKITRGVVHA